jgi:glutamate-ammonia-ligase adenylyltransferase
MASLANPSTFRDPARAQGHLILLEQLTPPGILARIRQQVADSEDPDAALQWLTRLAAENEATFHRATRSPATLKAFVTIFAFSDFLARELCRQPETLEDMLATRWDSPGRKESFEADLAREIAGVSIHEFGRALARFRRRQYLRILLRDAMGAPLAETVGELSNLADAILEAAYRRVRDDLTGQHGEPIDEDAGERAEMSVLALGKLGGQELNYSSDVDLMFVYSANGETAGPARLANKEFYCKLANALTALLSSYTENGLCYRVDLRLRPEGRLGDVAISLDAARQYYRHRARDWELQMLIKGRVAAGEPVPGERLLEFAEPLIYSTTLDFQAIESVSDARLRIHEKNSRKQGVFDVKLAPGGIRDIEFLVQCLQRLHGGREPWVRHGGTLLALARLRQKDLLAAGEYADLVSAYEFLRHIEHRLQIVEDRQTHSVPVDAEALDLLARRLSLRSAGGPITGQELLGRLESVSARVQQIYERVIHARRPLHLEVLVETDDLQTDLEQMPLGRVAPRESGALDRFLDLLAQQPADFAVFSADSRAAAHAKDIFEHSQWLADALNRQPEMALELRDLELAWDVRQPMTGTARDPREIRRRFRSSLFRLLSESLCLQRPIFDTLQNASVLADAAIDECYRHSVTRVRETAPPRTPSYRARKQMMTIALGRLGMMEFDLASDADLIFVLPDEEEAELPFWTRVAERMIAILSAYTGEGTVFAVDTRLRAGGRDGPLVQLERSYKEYFEKNAEAWEGIAYMKARAVAGDIDRATSFLSELQQLDWRRYGQGGRSRQELVQMRARLEKEQGGAKPLKAGPGGYYDIDFALMYLRLKGAGMFFRALNTPQRIDIVEQMGHLERGDANFLRDAAMFYRAIDHGIRLQTGHAGGRLPSSPARLRQLTEMVRRWTPAHLHDQPLGVELAQIQTRTRECFDRLFAA